MKINLHITNVFSAWFHATVRPPYSVLFRVALGVVINSYAVATHWATPPPQRALDSYLAYRERSTEVNFSAVNYGHFTPVQGLLNSRPIGSVVQYFNISAGPEATLSI